MEERESVFKLALVPGLIVGLINVGLMIVIWAIVSDMENQQYLGLFSWFVVGVLYFFYTKNYRENNLGGSITYGESFKFMMFMSMVVAVFSSIYTYVLMAYLDPDIINRTLELTADKLYSMNMPEETIEMQLEMQKKFVTPGISALSNLPTMFIVGLIISLIISIFTIKEVNTFEE